MCEPDLAWFRQLLRGSYACKVSDTAQWFQEQERATSKIFLGQYTTLDRDNHNHKLVNRALHDGIGKKFCSSLHPANIKFCIYFSCVIHSSNSGRKAVLLSDNTVL